MQGYRPILKNIQLLDKQVSDELWVQEYLYYVRNSLFLLLGIALQVVLCLSALVGSGNAARLQIALPGIPSLHSLQNMQNTFVDIKYLNIMHFPYIHTLHVIILRFT